MTSQVLGTHAGILHVLDLTGERVKSVKPHSASITDICVDETADFIGTASLDGEFHGLSASFIGLQTTYSHQDRS